MAHGDITHVEIPVADKAAATAFYGEVFGWQIDTMEGFEEYPMWRSPNGVSGGGLTSPGEAFGQPLSYVEVDSIDDTLAKVQSLGGSVKVPKMEIDPTSWSAVFEDADGNAIGLFEGSVGAEE